MMQLDTLLTRKAKFSPRDCTLITIDRTNSGRRMSLQHRGAMSATTQGAIKVVSTLSATK
jgi:hypothetical protein